MEQVSIIIPCYNGASTIVRCLQSCFRQTYPEVEIILVDNNSTDDSVAIAQTEAEKAGKTITVVECREQGLKHARSMGNSIAKGSYIQMLDADDELGPDKIANQVAALEISPGYSVAYCDWNWCFLQPSGKWFEVKFTSRQFEDFLLHLLLDNWHPPHAYLFRRDVVEQVTPHYSKDNRVKVNEDREFITFAALTGGRFLHVHGPVAIYNNWSDQQITRKTPSSVRTESLARIFSNLNEYINKQSPDFISDMHRELLGQSWGKYKLAPGKLVREGSLYKLDKRKRKTVKVLPLEAMVIRILKEFHAAEWFEMRARQVLRGLHVNAFHLLEGTVPDTEIHQRVLEKTNRYLLTGAREYNGINDLPSLEQDQSIEIPNLAQKTKFLLNGPLFLPTFPIQRFIILKALQRLCDKGIFMEE